MERFQTLDSLRGVFAILVVFFHMNIIGSFTELSFFRGSSIFVEFFFVLSGFVLAHSYLKKTNVDARKYLISRFFRVFPMHIMMLFLFIGMHLLLLILSKYFHLSFPTVPFTGKNAYSEIIPNLTLIHAWLPRFEGLSFNGPSWSISIEFYLYLIFLVGLILFKKNIVVFSLAFMLFGISGFFYDYDFTTTAAYRGLSCFFAGVLAYKIYSLVKIKTAFIEPLLILIIIVFVTYVYEVRFGIVIAPFLFSFVVYVFAHEKGMVSKILKTNFLKKMGDLSFSIYIIHYFIITILLSLFVLLTKKLGFNFARKNDDIWMMDTGSVIINNILPFFILAIVIIISIFTRKYIEDTFIKIGKKISNK